MPKKILNVSAGAILKNHLVFVAKRGNSGKTAFLWEFPGGKLEPGETFENALIRELKEELDVNVRVENFLCNSKDEYEDLIISINYYICSLIDESLPRLNEHSESMWANKEELSRLSFAPSDFKAVSLVSKLIR